MIGVLRAGLFFGAIVVSGATVAQDSAPVESFGENGKLYHVYRSPQVTEERFLLTRRPFGTEEGSGYEGDIRVVYTYPGDVFETRLVSYVVQCTGEQIEARTYQGDSQNPINSRSATINETLKHPKLLDKDEYNLYWALCKNVFRKYK